MKPWLNNTLLLLSQYYHNNNIITTTVPRGVCTVYGVHTLYSKCVPDLPRARIYKRLRIPGIDSKDSIPPAYAWRSDITLFVVPARQAT
jgi:hypothetical protein